MCVKFEIKRLLIGKNFWLTLLTGMVFSIAQVLYENISYFKNPLLGFSGVNTHPASVFYRWMGGKLNVFLTTYLYIFPILVVSAHAISYYKDLKTGYIKNILINASRKQYLIAKYVVSFVSGGIVFTVPMIINFLINAAFLPALRPFIGISYMKPCILMSSLAYYHPIIHFLIFMIIYFLFGGAFACVGLVAARVIRNEFLLALFPCVLAYALSFVSSLLLKNTVIKSISPYTILSIVTSNTSWVAVIGELLCLIAGSFLIYYYGGKKNDVL
ncbi:MAG: hypothetical protein ACI4E1_02430 [Lachnospira sp.]